MPRSMTRALILMCALLFLPSCGGGSGGGDDDEPGIHSASPSTFFSEIAQTITIHGLDFGPAGAATVRLTAASGTPFVGGTQAFVDVPAVVVDDTTITFTSPIAQMCPTGTTAVAVRVTLADATVYDSDGFIMNLSGPTLASFEPNPVAATIGTPFTITGTGFGPILGAATVEFTASAGTPFAGGASATASVPALIASPTSMSGITPVAVGGADFTATVHVTFAGGSCVTSTANFVTFEANAAPLLSSTSPIDLPVAVGDRISFSVTATDPEGDNVTLRLLNPPAGAVFNPIVAGASPVVGLIEWTVSEFDEPGPMALIFRANDVVNPTKTRTLAVFLHLTPVLSRTVKFGDVTGDGISDVVAFARNADAGGSSDSGEAYVWAGAASPSGTPTASLRVAGSTPLDRIGSGGMRLADVTGDGVLDVIVASDQVDIGGLANAGAIYVWFGGVTLTGVKAPDATLVTGALGASTGLAADPLRWNVGDVTGDGIADIVASAPLADRGAVDTGDAFVWRGGVTLVGVKGFDIELISSAIGAGDELGQGGILLEDASGDGVLDVIAAAPKADAGMLIDPGAVFLWKPNLAPVGPSALVAFATMRATTAIGGEMVGTGAASRIRVADVSGDGVVDVLVPSPGATAPLVGSGAIYFWLGGATLIGAKAQDATLFSGTANLGDALTLGAAGRIIVGDVTNDGIADVIGVASRADIVLAIDAGIVYLWNGGGTLTGNKAQDATLTVAAPLPGDRLGSGGTRLADVSNDGILDVVTSAPFETVAALFAAGAVHVWNGGAGLTGVANPSASLRVGNANDDRLSYEAKELTFASRFGDVTGDGVLDLVVPAFRADVSGTADAGQIYVWRGGATLAGAPSPLASLRGPGSAIGDMLGLSSGANVALADVSGDGLFDVVSAAASADLGTALNAGALYMWRGGGTLTGILTPTATMRATTLQSGDQLSGGLADGVAWDLVDVNGDFVRDVVALAPLADTGGGIDAGAACFFAGGVGLTGNRTPTATFFAPTPMAGDRFGASGGNVDLLFFADVTNDLQVDILIGASSWTGPGPSERGGLFLWKGAVGLSGTPAADSTLAVPTAAALDRLGN